MEKALCIIGFGFILLACMPISIQAQVLYIVNQRLDTIPFEMIAEGRNLRLNVDQLPSSGRFSEIRSIQLIGGDLEIQYGLADKNIVKDSKLVQFEYIMDEGGNRIIPLEYKTRTVPDPADLRSSKLIWQDALEDVLEPNRKYKLVISRSLLANVDCTKEMPSYTIRDQWPHYAIAAGGVSALVIGQIYRTQRDDVYDAYTTKWVEGFSSADAKPDYDRVRKLHKQSKDWTNVGLVVLTADAVLFTYRWLSIRSKQKTYKKFCDPNVDLGFERTFNPDGSIASSLKLTTTF